ncbi:hypothetical protein KQI45_18250 [Clostridium sporogenes]|uniref:hypothetical protein n=1 Tax=Clostridium sporogenes TaxID=1509 RepID=UPI001969D56E|nr:hypothetical protein [Clostridium sporogenes]MBU5301967.1 hypothetical protein [Clostridium sporogenes]
MNKRSSRFKFYLELLLRLTEIIKTAIFIVVYLKIFEISCQKINKFFVLNSEKLLGEGKM